MTAEFDDILTEYIGEFGKFQFIFYLSLCLHPILAFGIVRELIFQSITPEYYCTDADSKKRPTNWTVPEHKITNTNRSIEKDECYYYQVVNSSEQNYDVVKIECTNWEYDLEKYGETVISEVVMLEFILYSVIVINALVHR